MAGFSSLCSDGYHKAIYYYEHGAISKLPTHEQFHAGCRHGRLARMLSINAGPFTRRLLSARAFRRLRTTAGDPTTVTAGGTIERFKSPETRAAEVSAAVSAGDDGQERPELRGLDGLLARLNEMDAGRALMMNLLNPAALVGGLGFRIPAPFVANHLLFSPHPSEQGVWDLQLIQPEPGGLELLSQRTEEARNAQTLRGKMLRTLGTRRVVGGHRFELMRNTDPDTGVVRYVDARYSDPRCTDTPEVVVSDAAWDLWYDHVLDTIERARRFEYLTRPPDDTAKYYPAPSVTRFLELCAQLEPADYAFFRDRTVEGIYPEIGWPRLPVDGLG